MLIQLFPFSKACWLRCQQGDLLGPNPGKAKESCQCASCSGKEREGEGEGEA